MLSETPHSTCQPINLRRKIYEFLLEEISMWGRLPSQDDIRQLFGGLSDNVDLHLEQLAREGLLIVDKNGGNGISLVPTYTRLPEVGLLGKVGESLARQGGSEFRASIGLDLRGIGIPMAPGMQMVQVFDDRMSEAGIEYGDIALVINSNPMSGNIVAIKEAEVMVLRRYKIISGIPHFAAENPTTPDLIPAWESEIHGVFWGLLRIESCRRGYQPAEPKLPISYLAGSSKQRSRETRSPDKSRTESIESLTPKTAGIRKKTPVSYRSQKLSRWPKPPSGVELNEGR